MARFAAVLILVIGLWSVVGIAEAQSKLVTLVEEVPVGPAGLSITPVLVKGYRDAAVLGYTNRINGVDIRFTFSDEPGTIADPIAKSQPHNCSVSGDGVGCNPATEGATFQIKGPYLIGSVSVSARNPV